MPKPKRYRHNRTLNTLSAFIIRFYESEHGWKHSIMHHISMSRCSARLSMVPPILCHNIIVKKPRKNYYNQIIVWFFQNGWWGGAFMEGREKWNKRFDDLLQQGVLEGKAWNMPGIRVKFSKCLAKLYKYTNFPNIL